MSDLVKRLRRCDEYEPLGHVGWEAADRIEELERELAIAEKMAADANEAYSQAHINMVEALDQLAAEKALADRLGKIVLEDFPYGAAAYDYRKARGL